MKQNRIIFFYNFFFLKVPFIVGLWETYQKECNIKEGLERKALK